MGGNFTAMNFFLSIISRLFTAFSIFSLCFFADGFGKSSLAGEVKNLNNNLNNIKSIHQNLKERLQAIEEKLNLLQENQTLEEVSPPSNSPVRKIIEDGFPQIEEISGIVSSYNSENNSFTPVSVGISIKTPTLFTVSEDSELIVSFPGKIAARVGGNSRIVIGPAKDGKYEVDLRNGTISALLDPNRDKLNSPSFSVRTKSGVTEATGTFYAVTEYKGQAYTSVKKGKVKKETIPPSKPDFSAYLKKASKPPEIGKSSKK